MIHTGPVSGEFTSAEQKSGMKCRACGADDVWFTKWESDCGGYEDYQYECHGCGKVWWVEGPDS